MTLACIREKNSGCSLERVNRNNMFFGPACIPGIVKQTFKRSFRLASDDESLQYNIFRETCCALTHTNKSITAPGFSRILQDTPVKNTGLPDPYHYVKHRNLQNSLNYIPNSRNIIINSSDKHETAVRAAIIGNVIGLSANPGFGKALGVMILTKQITKDRRAKL